MKRTVRNFVNTLLLSGVFIAWGEANLLRAQVPQEAKIAVSGVVSDADGPVIGASVVETGTPGNGVATDLDGKYTLRVSPNATLRVSYLGYATREIAVNGRTSIDITLLEDAEMLAEVVVIGYGSQTKKELTGSIASIKAEQFNKGIQSNPMGLLQGKVAGLTVIKNGGDDPAQN
uniref:carboxypeptidase-like regulatory domain-containing protein n=1 Tax=Candidatus Symbiothrix dinenymphae TaxID=467085 RepID=UPI000B0F6015